MRVTKREVFGVMLLSTLCLSKSQPSSWDHQEIKRHKQKYLIMLSSFYLLSCSGTFKGSHFSPSIDRNSFLKSNGSWDADISAMWF